MENNSESVIADIKKTIERQELFKLSYLQKMISDLQHFEFNRKYVPASSAFGDVYRYSTSYNIGKFRFHYNHINADGEIADAFFRIDENQNSGDEKKISKEDIIFVHSYMDSLLLMKQKESSLPYWNAMKLWLSFSKYMKWKHRISLRIAFYSFPILIYLQPPMESWYL
eukprot:TRINITY_DN4905_c0_g1_i1.p1 TRINITY_DN4905_c0_g1~~TRINITY_DN4905_c0_g1_i1.p1  ORF type:complete len:169 (+),score=12.10 TRINITY_DN4905_c0_g1_i1:239-745(+)